MRLMRTRARNMPSARRSAGRPFGRDHAEVTSKLVHIGIDREPLDQAVLNLEEARGRRLEPRAVGGQTLKVGTGERSAPGPGGRNHLVDGHHPGHFDLQVGERRQQAAGERQRLVDAFHRRRPWQQFDDVVGAHPTERFQVMTSECV